MERYINLRRIAKLNNDSMPADHPCRRGFADCCRDPRVPVVPGDIKHIKTAIKRGNIPRRVIADAKERVKKEPTICPFLNNSTGECTIYAYRPLICVATGALALPTREGKNKLETENPPGLMHTELRPTMCSHCIGQELQRGRGINKQALKDSQQIIPYISLNSIPICDFVKKL